MRTLGGHRRPLQAQIRELLEQPREEPSADSSRYLRSLRSFATRETNG
jgi:hypothetical protein